MFGRPWRLLELGSRRDKTVGDRRVGAVGRRQRLTGRASRFFRGSPRLTPWGCSRADGHKQPELAAPQDGLWDGMSDLRVRHSLTVDGASIWHRQPDRSGLFGNYPEL
jgi:hypothetical protein